MIRERNYKNQLYVMILGIGLGILASATNQNKMFYPAFIGPLSITYGYWVIFGMIIVLKSKTAQLAGINCLLFFLLMNLSFYLYEYAITGVFQSKWLLKWLIMSLFTTLGGFIMWFWKSERQWTWLLFIFPLFFLGEDALHTIVSLRFDQLVYQDGLGVMVPMNGFYLINKLIIIVIYLGFLAYLVSYRIRRLKIKQVKD